MNIFSLERKVAIVTGANRGIGKSIALTLADAGASVVICGRSRDKNEEVVKEIKAKGKEALGVTADLNNIDEIDALITRTCEKYGSVDILVNNAGISSTNFALSTTEDEWDQVMELNVKSLFFCAQKVAAQMKAEGKGGKIINMSSVAGQVGEVGISPYTASKGAVINLTRSLALEWARYNIQVNGVGPAYIETDMNKEQLSIPKVKEKIIEKTPMKRLGTAEELAGAILLLAGSGSSFITGQTIFVDGGWLAQ